MSQEIKYIAIDDLHLWTENPRDVMDTSLTDMEVMEKAINDENSKWNLPKMLKEMGERYDFSEIPTVVIKEGKHVLYDGNRRIAVLKYIQNKDLYAAFGGGMFPEMEPDELLKLKEIPCNVCSEAVALDNIERKHSNSGSWTVLDREYFLFKHRGRDKSLFLQFEEATGLISKNPHLNKRFVMEEVLTNRNLLSLGMKLEDGKLLSVYSDDESQELLDNLSILIKEGKLSTRTNAEKGTVRVASGELGEQIEKLMDSEELDIKKFKSEDAKVMDTSQISDKPGQTEPRRSPREKSKIPVIFGRKRYLSKSKTNSVYMDIESLFEIYLRNSSKLSQYFPSLIRMSLRLLVECAAESQTISMDDYIKNNFQTAKSQLSQDEKTTLATQNVKTEAELITLLHVGAHKYTASNNLAQTLVMSLVIGEMLEITHPK